MYTLWKSPGELIIGEDNFYSFIYLKRHLQTFKNISVWKKHQWCTFLSYIAYSYAITVINNYFIEDYDDYLGQYISLFDETLIEELCLFTSYKNEMIEPVYFMEFYNIIDKYPIEQLDTYLYIQEFIIA